MVTVGFLETYKNAVFRKMLTCEPSFKKTLPLVGFSQSNNTPCIVVSFTDLIFKSQKESLRKKAFVLPANQTVITSGLTSARTSDFR